MIVCVGVAARDTIYRISEFPEPDGRVLASQRVVAGGGTAATAAVAIAKLGVPARFVGIVDEDLPGVETVRLPGEMVESTILVGDGTRAIITEPWTPFECPPDALEDAEWVHVDHVGYDAIHGDVRLSVDGGNPIPDLDMSRVELYAPNRDDGRRARITVITRGADGCTAYVGEERLDVPGYPVDDVVSTLGAGDVFHGALLAALVRGLDLAAALTKANAAAALSCRALDGRSAIPTWEELP
ncbi:MAG TPA: carbohydrate kinase family protein [Gaiellaceae bacterium]